VWVRVVKRERDIPDEMRQGFMLCIYDHVTTMMAETNRQLGDI